MASAYTTAMQTLIDALGRLPGVGPKSAQRIAFHLLKTDAHDVEKLASAITEAKALVQFCQKCFNFSEGSVCHICDDSRRDQTVLCVVEESRDIVAIEKTGEFRGRYHVLNGALSPMSGIGPGQLRMKELFERIDAAAAEGSPVREVIIATNPSPEGDVTLLYLQERLGTKVPSITSMARGLPFGADLQYADAVTILRSLEERRGVE